jgi:hypothetical protein
VPLAERWHIPGVDTAFWLMLAGRCASHRRFRSTHWAQREAMEFSRGRCCEEQDSGHDVRRSHSLTLNSLSKSYVSSFRKSFLARGAFERPDNSLAMQSTACRRHFEPPSTTQLDRSESSARPEGALDSALCTLPMRAGPLSPCPSFNSRYMVRVLVPAMFPSLLQDGAQEPEHFLSRPIIG